MNHITNTQVQNRRLTGYNLLILVLYIHRNKNKNRIYYKFPKNFGFYFFTPVNSLASFSKAASCSSKYC